MSTSQRDLTHPSWHRALDAQATPRESLMSQMVRAQLIFDRRTPASGMPVWRDAEGDVTAVRLDARVGEGAGEFFRLAATDESGEPAPVPAPESVPFAQELADRLQLARDRVEAEQVHLAQVGTVAAEYLERTKLRLVK